jgi:hypothetical protein
VRTQFYFHTTTITQKIQGVKQNRPGGSVQVYVVRQTKFL